MDKYAGWELKNLSEPKTYWWKKGGYMCYAEEVEKTWYNGRISGKNEVVEPIRIGKMMWIDNNKYSPFYQDLRNED